MIGIFGDVLLMIIIAMGAVQALAPLGARILHDDRFLKLSYPASFIQAMAATSALAALITGYAISDFSLLNVIENSHTDKPLIYKITGAWGNHEGSMLLWLWVLAAFGFMAALRNKHLHVPMLAVQGALVCGLALFVLWTSNPFVTVFPAASQGQDLNPLLQDIGLAIHPPMLYLGYVGFGIVYAYALAGMLTKRVDSQWARIAHPWICASWAFLTFGIGLGSWWAYRELGWGGWWFWDPVENVSLLPWLGGTALMHSNIVLMKRGQFAAWTMLLAIITFSLSLIGTFIVRSGVLVSVHSFASDPDRGLYILMYFLIVSGLGLLVFSRYSHHEKYISPALLSRDTFIRLNNIFVLSAAATILLAILYPIIMQMLQQPSITVGAPYYNQMILPLMVPLVIMAGFATSTPWQQGTWRNLSRALWPMAAISFACVVIGLAIFEREALLMSAGVALGVWLIGATAASVMRSYRIHKKLTRAVAAYACGHIAFGILVIGITFSGLQKTTVELALANSQTHSQAGYDFAFIHQELGAGQNYAFRKATIRVSDTQGDVATLTPELRFYPTRSMHTVEAAIDYGLWRDVYLSSGLQADPDMLGFSLHINPAMGWIWFSFGLASLGGLLAATRRV